MARAATLLIVVLAVAFATNPDDASFRRYVEDGMARQGAAWFERKLVSTVSALAYPRQDYKFFSVVAVEEADVLYVGAFGTWVGMRWQRWRR